MTRLPVLRASPGKNVHPSWHKTARVDFAHHPAYIPVRIL